MNKIEKRASDYCERHGIINYQLKGKKLIYYRRYKVDVFGNYETSKHEVNMETFEEKVTVLKRNIKMPVNPV